MNKEMRIIKQWQEEEDIRVEINGDYVIFKCRNNVKTIDCNNVKSKVRFDNNRPKKNILSKILAYKSILSTNVMFDAVKNQGYYTIVDLDRCEPTLETLDKLNVEQLSIMVAGAVARMLNDSRFTLDDILKMNEQVFVKHLFETIIMNNLNNLAWLVDVNSISNGNTPIQITPTIQLYRKLGMVVFDDTTPGRDLIRVGMEAWDLECSIPDSEEYVNIKNEIIMMLPPIKEEMICRAFEYIVKTGIDYSSKKSDNPIPRELIRDIVLNEFVEDYINGNEVIRKINNILNGTTRYTTLDVKAETYPEWK